MKTKAHPNSIDSYYGLDLTRRQMEVVESLRSLGKATDQEIAYHLNYTVNRVTGRITELRSLGIVIEDKPVKGDFGKFVRVCRLKRFDKTLF